MFCLQRYQEDITDRARVYLSYSQDSINTLVIYGFALAQVSCTSLCFTQQLLTKYYGTVFLGWHYRTTRAQLSLPQYHTVCVSLCLVYRRSYISAHVLLNLLKELGKRDKMQGLSKILSLFRNEFNNFNNTIARMLDSIYHMTLSIH